MFIHRYLRAFKTVDLAFQVSCLTFSYFIIHIYVCTVHYVFLGTKYNIDTPDISIMLANFYREDDRAWRRAPALFIIPYSLLYCIFQIPNVCNIKWNNEKCRRSSSLLIVTQWSESKASVFWWKSFPESRLDLFRTICSTSNFLAMYKILELSTYFVRVRTCTLYGSLASFYNHDTWHMERIVLWLLVLHACMYLCIRYIEMTRSF